MKQVDLREGALRQHRVVAMFALIQCWLRDLDGVCFKRIHLERLIGLEKFKKTRITWLTEDLSETFPYQEKLVFSKGEAFASLFVSKKPFVDFPVGNMSDQDRIDLIGESGPRIGIFSLWQKPSHETKRLKKDFQALMPIFADYSNYDERLMISYLSLIVSGHISPKTMLDSIGTRSKK